MKVWAFVILAGFILVGVLVDKAGDMLEAAEANGYDRAMLEVGQSQMAMDQAWRKEVSARERQNEMLQLSLIEEKRNIKTVTEIVEVEVVKYVKDDVSCNLSRGAVSLLNQLWGYPANAGTPKGTNLTEDQKRETSTISQRSLIKGIGEYAEWCRKVEKEFDTLVEATNNLGY